MMLEKVTAVKCVSQILTYQDETTYRDGMCEDRTRESRNFGLGIMTCASTTLRSSKSDKRGFREDVGGVVLEVVTCTGNNELVHGSSSS